MSERPARTKVSRRASRHTAEAFPAGDSGDPRPSEEDEPRPSEKDEPPRRARTPGDPDSNDHGSMWPDLWAGHRR
jgi:hypothetical protein